MTRTPRRTPAARARLGGGLALALTAALLAACAQPTPTPMPTPTEPPTLAPPTEPAPTTVPTVAASDTPEPSASPPPPSPAPTRKPESAAPAPTRPPAAAYEVHWWADQAHLPKDLGCTQINWEVVGAKEVYLRWPHQDENKVEARGRQEGVCIDEGERAVFTLRVVKPDGSQDIREMALERDE